MGHQLEIDWRGVAELTHIKCYWDWAADEEAFLLATLGDEFRQYLARTGRLFPRVLPPATKT